MCVIKRTQEEAKKTHSAIRSRGSIDMGGKSKSLRLRAVYLGSLSINRDFSNVVVILSFPGDERALVG